MWNVLYKLQSGMRRPPTLTSLPGILRAQPAEPGSWEKSKVPKAADLSLLKRPHSGRHRSPDVPGIYCMLTEERQARRGVWVPRSKVIAET